MTARTYCRNIPGIIVVAGLATLVGMAVGVRVGATGTSLPAVNMSGGDNVHVTCGGPSISIGNQVTSPSGPSSFDATCLPPPTTTTTSGPSSGAPVTMDVMARQMGGSPVTVTVGNSAPELAVAFVSAYALNSGPGETASVSGGGLTWMLAGRADARSGDAEVWWAWTGGGNFTATGSVAGSNKNIELTVVTFAGASGVGATKAAGAPTGAPTATLTPTATGSLVFAVGFDFDRATLRVVPAGQSLDSQDTDVAGDTYWVQHVNAHTTAGQAVTASDTAPTGDQWNAEAVEVTPSGGPLTTTTTAQPATTTTTTTTIATTTTGVPGQAPVLDASSPPFAAVTNNIGSITTAAFAPPAGSVVYAVFSMDSLPGSGMNVASVANTGTALTWHLVSLENHSGGTTVGGFVEVFFASNPTNRSGLQVTGTFNLPSKNVAPPVGGLQVLVVDHAASDQSTAASDATSNVNSTSAPTGTVVTTAANTLVLGVFDNWDSSVDPTVGAGQAVVSEIRNNTDRDTYWVQRVVAPVATAGAAVTVNAAAPSNIHWHEITWEVRAA